MKIKIVSIILSTILFFSVNSFAARLILCPSVAAIRASVFYTALGQQYYFIETDHGLTYEVLVTVANSLPDAEKILNNINYSYSLYARTIPNGKKDKITLCSYAPYAMNPSTTRLSVLWLAD